MGEELAWRELVDVGALRSFVTGEHLIRWNGGARGGLVAIVDGVCKVAIALTPVRASVISVEAFDEWLDGTTGAGRRLATMLATRLGETARPQTSAHHRVDVRVADRILFLADRFTGSGMDPEAPVEVPLTHDDYAAWVGATRAVATRSLGALRARGFVDFGRGWIQVRDRLGLEQFVREA